MLPVIEAEALNIVVIGPNWGCDWTNMLSFKYMSMAFFGNPGNLDRMFILTLGEESFETNLIVYFVFCHGRLYFVSECL